MPSHTIRNIDSKLWREVKGECGYRGVKSIDGLILDLLKRWVEESKKLRKKEKEAGL